MPISVKQDSYAHSGLEVYLTKEPEVEVKKIGDSEDSEENKDDTSTSDSNSDSELNSDEKFRLLNGETVQIDYYDDMFDNSYEYDYEDISCNANVSMPRVDKNFYKGKKLALLKKWQAPEQKLKWKDLEKVIVGFITEQTYSEDGVDLKIAGVTKLLDQEKEFNFSQRKISEILTEMIEAAGLKADVNPKGLKDDVIDYTNVSSSGDSSSSEFGYSSIPDLAKQVCKGKTTDRDKAQAIHTYIRDHVDYPPDPIYEDHKKCPKEALASGICNCCDRARIGHEMANAVGLENQGVHGTGSCGHVWIQYKINGQWVDSDPGVSRPNIGSVYEDMAVDGSWDFPAC